MKSRERLLMGFQPRLLNSNFKGSVGYAVANPPYYDFYSPFPRREGGWETLLSELDNKTLNPRQVMRLVNYITNS